jgi:hypothetical protein
MSIVNCRVAYIRPEYTNLKEWMSNPDHVYIARGGVVFINGERFPKSNSDFCNPFKLGKDGSRDEVIQKYKEYMETRLHRESGLVKKLIGLKGKKLGCWCKPDNCHGDVLIELIDKYTQIKKDI